METMNLLPVDNGLNGSTLGAFGGALVGSWFGEGWGGWGNGRNGGGQSAAVAAIDTSAILNGVEAVRDSVGQTRDAVYQTSNQTALGLCNLGYQGAQDTASVISALNQGFSGINSTMIANGYESRLSGRDLQAQLAACCCDTQKTIMAEGAATRALIDKYAYEDLQTKLCDSKAKIAALEANAFTAASNQAQTQTILSHLSSVIKPFQG